MRLLGVLLFCTYLILFSVLLDVRQDEGLKIRGYAR